MSFLDLVLRAEISRYEDADFGEYALRYCDERPETRDQAINQLKAMIYDKGEIKPRRTDDDYLLRFLRARRFVIARAHRLMVRYEEFHKSNQHLYRVDISQLRRIKGIYEGVVPDSPVWGRICILRLGKWDPKVNSVEDLMRLSLLMSEMGAMQPKLQILGGSLIVDLEGFGLQHTRYLNVDLLKQLINYLRGASPNVVRGFHIINSSWVFNTLFSMCKPFIPTAAWDIVYFHGSDLGSLRRHIGLANLPPCYGGTCQYVVPSELWLTKIMTFKDDFLTEELRALGYIVKD